MPRLPLPRLGAALCAALLAAGCLVVVSPTPPSQPTAAVITSTLGPAPTQPAGPSPTAPVIAILTPTASGTPAPATDAPPTHTPPPSATLAPTDSAADTTPTLPHSHTPLYTAAPTLLPPPNATAPPISIALFTVDPPEIRPGDPVTLNWQASGLEAVIWRLAPDGRLAVSYTVPLSGTLTLATPPDQQGRVDFMLFAAAGASSAQALVSVRVLCAYDWFLSPAPAECPGSAPRQTRMAAERFERGVMLWTQLDDRIFVLYSDGASPAWDVLANGWFEGQPEDDPSLTPPPGLYQPRRGFGLAWRTGYVSPVAVIRDRLGWAVEPEFEIPAGYWQCDANTRSRCYLTGPAGLVYVLQPERSAWSPWP